MNRKKKLRVGFTFNFSKGGPSNFLRSLKQALKAQSLAKTSYFIDPFVDCNIFANKARNYYNKPFFFRVDGIAMDEKMDVAIKKERNEILLYGLQNSKGVVYQSKFALELCSKILNYTPHKYRIITNGVDLKTFSKQGNNLRKELNIENDSLVFISVAKWRAHKRLLDVIKTYEEFEKTSKKKCYLIIIGGGESLNIQNYSIIQVPEIQRDKIPIYLRTADIFLFYSWLDNCPNTVIESLACGVPVICTNQGGTKEIIEATNGGIVVDADDEFSFQEVDLYNPPKPDYIKLLDAIKLMSKELAFYKNQINSSKIDINRVAKAYYNFILSCNE